MKNFEFKSQVATSIEQSKRLLELGLKKETADMVWVNDSYNTSLKESLWRPVVLVDCEAIYVENHRIPAWSLHRIVEIMFKGDIDGFVGYNIHANNVGIMYKYAISNIEALIKMGSFNKDYLEKK